MSETNNKLEIKNLSKRFGEKILFENLSLTVDDPAVLWAPSGWGKTISYFVTKPTQCCDILKNR